MTEEQLHALLDSYEKRVPNSEDRKLFAEAIRAAKASAPRAAYFTLWICCVESLKRRFKELSKYNPCIDESLVQISSMEVTQAPGISVLIERAQQHDLILGAGAAKLERIYAMQQTCSRATEESPLLENFVADAFAVVNSVLSRSGTLECDSALEQALVLSRDINSLVDTLRQHLGVTEPV